MIWIQQIVKKDPNTEIALFGVSIDLATVMMTCGESSSNVKVIIERDCGYSTVGDEFYVSIKRSIPLAEVSCYEYVNTVTKLRAGYDLEASAIKQVAKN